MKVTKKPLLVRALQLTPETEDRLIKLFKELKVIYIKTSTGFEISAPTGVLTLTSPNWFVYGEVDRTPGVVKDEIFKETYQARAGGSELEYEKKPVTVTAEHLPDLSTNSLLRVLVLLRPDGQPLSVDDLYIERKRVSTAQDLGYLEVQTLEGPAKLQVGDYLIKGIKGECYPVTAKVFSTIYEVPKEEGDLNES